MVLLLGMVGFFLDYYGFVFLIMISRLIISLCVMLKKCFSKDLGRLILVSEVEWCVGCWFGVVFRCFVVVFRLKD